MIARAACGLLEYGYFSAEKFLEPGTSRSLVSRNPHAALALIHAQNSPTACPRHLSWRCTKCGAGRLRQDRCGGLAAGMNAHEERGSGKT